MGNAKVLDLSFPCFIFGKYNMKKILVCKPKKILRPYNISRSFRDNRVSYQFVCAATTKISFSTMEKVFHLILNQY